MASWGKKRAWYVLGIGCLTLLIVGTILVSLMLLIVTRESRDLASAKIEPLSVTIPLGLTPGAVTDLSPGGASGAPAPDAAATPSLRLALRLSDGIFTVQPGPAGSDIHVEGSWDPAGYELNQETAGDGSTREITVRFRRKGFFSLSFDHEKTPNHVTVTIPEGIRTALVLQITRARSEIELGGMMLTDLWAGFAQGEHRVSFGRPIVGSLASATFHSSLGLCHVHDLGNARPASFSFQGSMGEVRVDLGGAWPAAFRAKGKMSVTMGGMYITAPRKIRVTGSTVAIVGAAHLGGMSDHEDEEGTREDEEEDPNAPVIELDISTTMAEISVRRM